MVQRRQYQIGALRIIHRESCVNYYWHKRWLLCSTPRFITFPVRGSKTMYQGGVFDLYYGLMINGRVIFRLPKWWRYWHFIIRLPRKIYAQESDK